MRTRSWSELECFVLGLIWQLGPVSAYAVRTQMQKSPSTQWSGSAGGDLSAPAEAGAAGAGSGPAGTGWSAQAGALSHNRRGAYAC